MTSDHPLTPPTPSADELRTIVDVQKVSRRFTVGSEDVWAVRDASLRIAQGQFVALMGRSGSGKTTLLNLIAGLDRPDQGSIRLAGQDITRASEQQLLDIRRHTIGFVFQSFGLLPLLSAYENVEIALRIAGVGLQERRERAQELLRTVDLHARSDHRPYELSGGEQQRVAIARALANRPALILADEPTGELDSGNARAIFQLLHELVRHEQVTILTATHDGAVLEYTDRVEEMADGRILEQHERDLTVGLESAQPEQLGPSGPSAPSVHPEPRGPAGPSESKDPPPSDQPEPSWVRPAREGAPLESSRSHPSEAGPEAEGPSRRVEEPPATPPAQDPPPGTLPLEPDFRPPAEKRAPWARD